MVIFKISFSSLVHIKCSIHVGFDVLVPLKLVLTCICLFCFRLDITEKGESRTQGK